jgi:hypothetical protein
MIIRMFLVAMTLLMVLASEGYSQEQNRLSIYYTYQNWKLDLPTPAIGGASPNDQKVGQGVFGLNATGVVSARFHVNLSGTMANTTSRLEYNNTANNLKQSLSSLNDTRVRLTYTIGKGQGAWSVFFNLPTGKRELTADQYELTAQLADVSRKFMVRRYGQGLDIGVDWFALPSWGSFGLNVGGGYLRRGTYRPLKLDTLESKEYKYGDEIFGSLGFSLNERPVGGSLGVTVRYYTKDKYDNKETFQAGVATTVSGAVTYNERFDLTLGMSMLMRGKAKIRSVGQTTLGATTVFIDEVLKSGRSQILAYANGSFPASEKLRVLGRLEFANVSANDYAKESLAFLPKSYYVGVGGGVGYALTDAFSASSMISYYTGKIDSDFGLTGLGLAFVLTYQPGRER